MAKKMTCSSGDYTVGSLFLIFKIQDTATVLKFSERLKKSTIYFPPTSVKSMLENEGNVTQAKRAGIGATLINQG